jgi:signal transduction histidine kinase/DNA-binding response OmpR family regulator
MKTLNKYLAKIKKPSILNDFLIIITGVILLMIILVFWLSNKIYTDYNKQNTLILNSTLKKIERAVVNDIKYTRYQMDYISQQIKQKGSSSRYIHKLLSSFRTGSRVNLALNWNMFSWVNKHKFIIIDGIVGVLQTPRDLSTRDYIPKTIKEPGKLHLGNPVHGAVSGQWIIPAGMGVTNKYNKYVGSIVFGFVIENFVSKIEGIIHDQGINFAILNQNNQIISTSSNFKVNQTQLNKLISNQKSLNELEQSSGSKSQITSLNKIKDYPIKIFIKYDDAFSSKKFLNEWIYYIAQFSIACILIIILLIVIRNKIISPIINLSKIADSVSRGNIDTEIPYFRSIEINGLANSLSDIKRFIKRENKLKQDLKKAQSKANNANNAKTKLLQSTSHDLKNYISSISGILNLIIKNKSDQQIENDPDLQDIKLVAAQSKELNYFVEDLLDLNLMENSQALSQKFEEVNLEELIKRLIILNKNLLIRNKIYVSTKIDGDLPKLKCDIKRVKQILMNLISNSAKYSPPQSNVLILANYDKIANKINLIVEDEGYGMTPEEIKMALAGKGEKIDKSEIDKPIDSHGIGFPQIDRLVKLHQGSMEVTSTKGQGTRIAIKFPLDGDVSESLKNNILVIDKSKSNFETLRQIIHDNIHDTMVHFTNSQKAAQESIKNKNYDLILNNIELKYLSNLEISDLLEARIPTISEDKKAKISKNRQISTEIYIRTIKKLIGEKDEIIHKKTLDEVRQILLNKIILVAEDELPNQLIMKKFLGKFGLIIDVANNGQEMLDKYVSSPKDYDIILTDINMPLMSGKAATIAIRNFENESNLKSIPIIACSSDFEKEAIHAFYYSKINDYFVKGRSTYYLVKILSFWIEGR